jgi:hypothetical protein
MAEIEMLEPDFWNRKGRFNPLAKKRKKAATPPASIEDIIVSSPALGGGGGDSKSEYTLF